MGQLRPKEGKPPPAHPPSPVCKASEPMAGLELGTGVVLFPSFLCSPQVPRGHSETIAPPPRPRFCGHISPGLCLLHPLWLCWDISLQAESAPWEQAANELQMSGPNRLAEGGCSDALTDEGPQAVVVVVAQTGQLPFPSQGT